MSAVVDAGAVPVLRAMLVSGSEAVGGVRNAMEACRTICAASVGRDAAVTAGVPAALVTVLKALDAKTCISAAWALEIMCVGVGGTRAMVAAILDSCAHSVDASRFLMYVETRGSAV